MRLSLPLVAYYLEFAQHLRDAISFTTVLVSLISLVVLSITVAYCLRNMIRGSQSRMNLLRYYYYLETKSWKLNGIVKRKR